MSAQLLPWLSVVVGAVQVLACFIIGRPLWPFLRAHAPRLLGIEGTPFILGIVLFLIVIPGALFFSLLSSSFGSASSMVPTRELWRPWIRGLGVGLSLCALYYGSKDLAKRRRRRDEPTVARKRDVA
jgi:hypothetical protein